jgi:hypothetical protein
MENNILYNVKKEQVIISDGKKKIKYAADEIYHKNGYIFILCSKYILNLFRPSFNKYYYQTFINLNVYTYTISKSVNVFPSNIWVLAVDEDNNIYDGNTIMQSFKMAEMLSK